MGLSSAALDRGWRPVLGDQVCGEIDASLGQHRGALGKLLGLTHDLNVAFHVLARPATRMSDIGKLREDEAELGEETEHLTGDALDVVLAADNDKPGDLVADQ